MFDAQPPKTSEFLDKEPRLLRDLREEFQQLYLNDDLLA